MKHLGIAMLAAALATACGGPDTSAITAAEAEAPCEDLCVRDLECQGAGESLADCTAECVGELAGWVRQDGFEDFVACATELTCAMDSEMCLDEIEPLGIHREWEEQCRAQLGTCPDFDAEACDVDASGESGLFRLIAPEIMGEMVECLEAADCEARFVCLQNVFEANGIDF